MKRKNFTIANDRFSKLFFIFIRKINIIMIRISYKKELVEMDVFRFLLP